MQSGRKHWTLKNIRVQGAGIIPKTPRQDICEIPNLFFRRNLDQLWNLMIFFFTLHPLIYTFIHLSERKRGGIYFFWPYFPFMILALYLLILEYFPVQSAYVRKFTLTLLYTLLQMKYNCRLKWNSKAPLNKLVICCVIKLSSSLND